MLFKVDFLRCPKKVNNLFLLSGLGERDDESIDADISVRKTKE